MNWLMGARVQLGPTLQKICETDYPESWPTLDLDILKYLASQNQKNIHGALFALRYLVKKYEFVMPDSERRWVTDSCPFHKLKSSSLNKWWIEI